MSGGERHGAWSGGRRRAHRTVFLMLLGAAVVSVGSAQTISEYLGNEPVSPDGNSLSHYGGITAGPDGNVWFTVITNDPAPPNNPASAAIARITPAGAITRFPIPVASAAGAIATGGDGNLWITEASANKIGRMTTSGVLTEFAVPTANSLLQGITAGPDGNLWFVEENGNNVGRITLSGAVSEFAIPTAVSVPESIASGPDGNLWFTEALANNIGRITPSGQITEFPVPTANAIPSFIAAGPDGNVWFTEVQGQNIGRVTPAGTITEFPVGAAAASPFGISAGSDGNMWFTANNNAIGRITMSGVVTAFVMPTPFTQGYAITAAPDGNLWFTEEGQSAIGRVTLGSCGGPTALCLSSSRFLVQATWEGEAPVPPPATAVRLSDEAGYFWFYDAANVEVVVKVINGCGSNGHYWVFVAGMTNVLVNLTVQDTQTGANRPYANQWGTPFAPIQDTSAFPCP